MRLNLAQSRPYRSALVLVARRGIEPPESSGLVGRHCIRQHDFAQPSKTPAHIPVQSVRHDLPNVQNLDTIVATIALHCKPAESTTARAAAGLESIQPRLFSRTRFDRPRFLHRNDLWLRPRLHHYQWKRLVVHQTIYRQ